MTEKGTDLPVGRGISIVKNGSACDVWFTLSSKRKSEELLMQRLSKYKPLAPLLSAVIVLGACNTNPSNAEHGDHPTPTLLLGTWASDCQNENPKKPNSKYVVASDVISDSRLISYARLFEDEECTIASNPHIREFKVALTFTGGRTETPLGSAL